MLLSILVPAVTERMVQLHSLLAFIEAQIKECDGEYGKPVVEVLSFVDNRCRSVGKKREALVKIANGEYVSFVDDDDWVSDDYVKVIVKAITDSLAVENCVAPDVISFNSECTIDGSNPFRVITSLAHKENEQAFKKDGLWQDIKRPPWHQCAWKRSLVSQYDFPDINYGEDWGWVSQFIGLAKTEVKIDASLHIYRFSSEGTIASKPENSNG